MDTLFFSPLGARMFTPFQSNTSARADWIELLRTSGQTLLSVSNWESILTALPKPTTHRKSSLPSMRDLSLTPKTENQNAVPGSPAKSDYPITTERAGIVSRFVEEIVFGRGVIWDVSATDDVKAKKKKGKK